MRKSYTAFKIRRSIRLPGYNYQQDGIYFITLCAYQNATFFGTICGGEMALGAMGEIVRKEWQRIPTIRKQIKLDHFAILPNHFHGLVIIDNSQVKDLAECMPGQPGKESHTLRSGSLGAVVGQFKLAVRRQAIRRGLHPPQSIWQRNYYEHIVRDEESLNEIRRYIIANPTRWHEDSLYVE